MCHIIENNQLPINDWNKSPLSLRVSGLDQTSGLEWVRRFCGFRRHRSLCLRLHSEQVKQVGLRYIGLNYAPPNLLLTTIIEFLMCRLLGTPYQWELLGRWEGEKLSTDLFQSNKVRKYQTFCFLSEKKVKSLTLFNPGGGHPHIMYIYPKQYHDILFWKQGLLGC